MENKCGIRLDIENFHESLNYAQKNSQNLRTNASKAFQEYFSQDSFSARVREIFQIDEENPQPLAVEPSTFHVNRVQTLAWSDFESETFQNQTPGAPGFVEYRNAPSLSKYLYVFLRPEILKFRINQVNFTLLIGSFLSRSGILIFRLISKFYSNRIKSKSKSRGKP